MAENSGFIGLGATLEISDGASPETWTAIANVKSIDGPNDTTEIIDATHLGSSGGYREKRPHLQDGGTVSAEVSFDPSHATHDEATGILYIKRNKLLRKYRINWSGAVDKDGAAVPYGEEFNGYVTNTSRSTPMDDLVGMSFEITVTGAPSIVSIP